MWYLFIILENSADADEISHSVSILHAFVTVYVYGFSVKNGLWAHWEEQLKRALKFKIQMVPSERYKLACVPFEY